MCCAVCFGYIKLLLILPIPFISNMYLNLYSCECERFHRLTITHSAYKKFNGIPNILADTICALICVGPNMRAPNHFCPFSGKQCESDHGLSGKINRMHNVIKHNVQVTLLISCVFFLDFSKRTNRKPTSYFIFRRIFVNSFFYVFAFPPFRFKVI